MITKIKTLPPHLLGTLLVTCSGILYGMLGYIGTQLFYLHFPIIAMLFWRFFIAALWILFSNALIWRRLMVFNPDTRSLLKIMLLGTMTYTAGSTFYFMASKHIGTGLAMVIFFSFPIFVTLFALASGKWKMNSHAFAALIAVLIGLVLLKGHGHYALNMGGILLALSSALCYAIYVYISHTATRFDSRLLTLIICSGNALICLMIAHFTHSFVVPRTLEEWGYICALGILATALPIQLLLDGLKYISPVKASILSVFEPVVTVLIGIALLHEKISILQAIGVIIVLSAAILIQFEKGSETHVNVQEGP